MYKSNIYKPIIVILLLIYSIGLFVPQESMTEAEGASAHRAVIIFTSEQEGNTITIDAELKDNKGLATLLLTLDYNTEYITLKNVKKGDALSQMDYLSSAGNNGDYSYLPFMMSWMVLKNDVNDSSNGTLLTFTFELDENTPDGNYDISLKYDKKSDVEYFKDGEIQQGSVIIGKTTIAVKNGVAEIVEEKEEEKKEPNIGLIVGLSVGGAFLLGSVTGFVIIFYKKKAKKKRGWKKIDG